MKAIQIKFSFLSLLIILFIFQSCSLEKEAEPAPVVGPTIGNLQTGNTKSLGSFTIGSGNQKTIGSVGAEVDLEGMQISQEGSSNSSLNISATPIEGHTFGSLITPISPLISIHVSNEADEFETLYKVVIPISERVDDDEFMMAFYYNATTGKLEGIPTVAYESNQLTIATTHFSDFFLTKVKLAFLPDKINTGFKPEVDGWPYTNYGTYYNPNGICAGMALTAMHVYANHGGNLYTKADNDLYPENPTPQFGYDDVHGIIYGDFGQDIYVKMFYAWHADLWLKGIDDAITYRCFAYSMSVTGEPQYIAVRGKTLKGGHAMVAYAIDEHQIFVYDPNFPARGDRIVNFRGNTSGTFDPYFSGNDAEEIANGNGVNYDLITYASKSALISTASLENGYQHYMSHDLYENSFAVNDLELVLKNAKGIEVARSTSPDMICSEKKVYLKYNSELTGITEGAIFYNEKFERLGTTEAITLDEKNETIIGVYNLGKKSGTTAWDWLGFKWFFVKFSNLDPNLFGVWTFFDGEHNNSWTFKDNGEAIQEIRGIERSWNWIIEQGDLKLFFENGTPAFFTYKIEDGKLYIWVESLEVWGVPFTKTG